MFRAVVTFIPMLMLAQSVPPCGVAKLLPVGKSEETRFFSHPLELVKRRLIQALAAAGAEVRKDEGNRIEAAHDAGKLRAAQGVTNLWATKKGGMGQIAAELEAGESNGKQGTRVSLNFRKNKFSGRKGKGGWATPILDETGCLLSSLTAGDPEKQPEGLPLDEPAFNREIRLPTDTLVKMRLLDVMYSKEAKADQVILFEAAQDLQADGAVVIRRGALATGRLSRFQGRKSYGRGTEVDIVIDSITAVNGQKIPLRSGAVTKGNAESQALGLPVIVGAFAKGDHVLIRAGTEYIAQTKGEQILLPK